MQKELLRMENIVKTFPGVKALNNAAITVHAGEVMGFMGENGAGKSTLMNVLGGVFPADSGDIYIEGKKVAIHSIHESQALGVAFIHQELALEPYLTIAENIFLGREMKNSFGMVSKDKMAEAARPFLERVGLDVDPNEFVGRLSIGQQQMVEIAKSFSLNAKILILDEPTSSLSEKEVDVLFDTVRDLKKQGMGIIFITHKMAEVFQLCDAVTIMRDGEFMGERQSAECSESELISLMVGRDLGNYYVRTYNKPGDIMMEVKNINAGKRAIDCSFQVRSGEILGFYGLVGAGRSELMKAIMGLDPMDSGEIYLNGEKTKKHDPAATAFPAARMLPSFAEPVISPGYDKALSKDDTPGNFFPGSFINFCDSCPGNIHLGSTLLVSFLLQIYQTDDFIFIQSQSDSFRLSGTFFRRKSFILGCLADSAASGRSGHICHLLVFDICRL